jgi:hypothetical protein
MSKEPLGLVAFGDLADELLRYKNGETPGRDRQGEAFNDAISF